MRPQLKTVVAVESRGTTSGATATGVIDTLDNAGWATIDIKTSTANNTTNNPSVLNLLEADVNAFSSAVTVDGFVGDTDFTIPVGQTGAYWNAKMNVDLRGRQRYLFVAVSPTTTMDIDVVANFPLREGAPITAAKAGVRVLVEG